MKHKKVLPEPKCIPNTRKMPDHDLVGKAFAKPTPKTPAEKREEEKAAGAKRCADNAVDALVKAGYFIEMELSEGWNPIWYITVNKDGKKVGEVCVVDRERNSYSSFSWGWGYTVSAIRLPRDRDGWGGYGWGERRCKYTKKVVEIMDEFGTPPDDIEEQFKVSTRKERELCKERDAAKKIRDLVLTNHEAGQLLKEIVLNGLGHSAKQSKLAGTIRKAYDKYDDEYLEANKAYQTFEVEHDKIAQAYDIWKEESGVAKAGNYGEVMS